MEPGPAVSLASRSALPFHSQRERSLIDPSGLRVGLTPPDAVTKPLAVALVLSLLLPPHPHTAQRPRTPSSKLARLGIRFIGSSLLGGSRFGGTCIGGGGGTCAGV